jgi:hypothetical protein
MTIALLFNGSLYQHGLVGKAPTERGHAHE